MYTDSTSYQEREQTFSYAKRTRARKGYTDWLDGCVESDSVSGKAAGMVTLRDARSITVEGKRTKRYMESAVGPTTRRSADPTFSLEHKIWGIGGGDDSPPTAAP
ncbi:hypothetical protein CCR75_006021 [Bremia lactucae]|uniref:Uncharacterized protein n=1 Tax=Bremia lactucae TaxID=4779 RepID=A0A976FJK0_BRELC|nr:hypothetical protein CCR75_006021 [Bremia lactucae]